MLLFLMGMKEDLEPHASVFRDYLWFERPWEYSYPDFHQASELYRYLARG